MKPFRIISQLLIGVLLAFLLHSTFTCETDYGLNYGELDDPELVIDYDGINEGCSAVEVAFLSGDKEAIRETLNLEAVEYYTDLLEVASSADLQEFGQMIKSREINAASEQYAEFKYTYDGKEYTFAMVQDTDASWKLIRF